MSHWNNLLAPEGLGGGQRRLEEGREQTQRHLQPPLKLSVFMLMTTKAAVVKNVACFNQMFWDKILFCHCKK